MQELCPGGAVGQLRFRTNGPGVTSSYRDGSASSPQSVVISCEKAETLGIAAQILHGAGSQARSTVSWQI
jgi:hypothetical protein